MSTQEPSETSPELTVIELARIRCYEKSNVLVVEYGEQPGVTGPELRVFIEHVDDKGTRVGEPLAVILDRRDANQLGTALYAFHKRVEAYKKAHGETGTAQASTLIVEELQAPAAASEAAE